MGKFQPCPGCQAQVDTSAFAPGQERTCPGCGANMNGAAKPGTRKITPAPAPAPATRSKRPPRERMTPIMRKAMNARMPGGGPSAARSRPVRMAKAGNTGLLIAGVVAVLVIVVGVVLVMKSQGGTPPANNGQGTAQANAQPTPQPQPVPQPAPQPDPEIDTAPQPTPTPVVRPPQPDPEPGPAPNPGPGGWLTGADTLIMVAERLTLPDADANAFDGAVRAGDIPAARGNGRFVPVAVERFLSDDERLARGALQFMRRVYDEGIALGPSYAPGPNPYASVADYGDAIARAEMYDSLRNGSTISVMQSWLQTEEQVRASEPPLNLSLDDVREIVGDCRDWSDFPELAERRRVALDRLQRGGNAALAHVVALIYEPVDGEWEAPMGRAALRILVEIHQFQATVDIQRMNAQDAQRIQQQAQNWLDQR